MDLSLVSMSELVDEIQKRHECYILSTLRYETGNDPVIRTYWQDQKFIDCLGMCSALEDDIKLHYRPNENHQPTGEEK